MCDIAHALISLLRQILTLLTVLKVAIGTSVSIEFTLASTNTKTRSMTTKPIGQGSLGPSWGQKE
jgi:hypothetical protein